MPDMCASQTGLRRVDAGWLYLLAGTALVSSMVLIGPADDLVQIRYRRDRLGALEDDAIAKLHAYETFLEAIDEADPMLVRRLAAAQLNLIPESSKPIGLVGAELDAHVDDWITETLPPPMEVASPKVKDSWLRRLSATPTRLWAMLAGVILIFIGLLPQAESAADLEKEAPDEESLAHQGELDDAMAWDEDAEVGEREEDDDEEEVDEFEGADLVAPAIAHRLVVAESGELLNPEDLDTADEPRVQVVTISASSAQLEKR